MVSVATYRTNANKVYLSLSEAVESFDHRRLLVLGAGSTSDRYGGDRLFTDSALTGTPTAKPTPNAKRCSNCYATDGEIIGWMRNSYGVLAVGEDANEYG